MVRIKMFSFKAVVRDSTNDSEYRLEHPLDGDWHLSHNDQELELKGVPRMDRDGGTVKATFVLQDERSEERQPTIPVPDIPGSETWTFSASFIPPHSLTIPQQLFAEDQPQAPTINGRALELIEWWIGGKRHLNGTVL